MFLRPKGERKRGRLPNRLAKDHEHHDDRQRNDEGFDMPRRHLPPERKTGPPLVADVRRRFHRRPSERAVQRQKQPEQGEVGEELNGDEQKGEQWKKEPVLDERLETQRRRLVTLLPDEGGGLGVVRARSVAEG